jgi:hypothetical protein
VQAEEEEEEEEEVKVEEEEEEEEHEKELEMESARGCVERWCRHAAERCDGEGRAAVLIIGLKCECA